jgi:hypothetical protein
VRRVLRVASFFALPFLVFWWTFPFISDRTLGNDYGQFVPPMQMELQFALRTGTVPLFVPGFSGGQPASALTVGQLFHPVSHVAARVPGYWTGHALDAGTLLKLLELGLTHLIVFWFLRRLRLQPVPAWLVALAAVYNLRMLDSFRYNIALESYAALLLLCASLGFLFLDPDHRWPKLAVAVCSYLLVASGHPQWAYFGLIGASAFCVALPFALPAIMPAWRATGPVRTMVTAFGAMAAGVLLASAYAVPFYFEFMRNNAWRVGRDYAWASNLSQPVRDLLGSLYDPLNSDVHGAFGGHALIVLAAGVPALRLFRIRVPAVIIAVWGFAALIVVAAAGSSTPLYRFLFDHVPLWSSFRVPGRLTLVMMPALVVLMAWAGAPPDGEGVNRRLPALAVVAAVALIVWHAVPHTLVTSDSHYSPYRINRLPWWADVVALGLLLASLVALAAIGRSAGRRPGLETVCALIVVGHTVVLMMWGTWRWPKPPTQTLATMVAQRLTADRLVNWMKEPTVASAPMQRYLRDADLDPRFAWIAHRCISVSSLRKAYRFVRDRRWPGELIIEGPAGLCGPGDGEAVASSIDTVNLEYVSFNRVVLDVQSVRQGFLAVNLPYTRWDSTSWRADMNGQRAPIQRANGILQAIAIPAGRCRVELRYWSWPAFIGVLMSAATAAALLAYAAGALRRSGWRTAARIAAVVTLAGCVHLWLARLYAGEGWGTVYSWTSAAGNPGSPADQR